MTNRIDSFFKLLVLPNVEHTVVHLLTWARDLLLPPPPVVDSRISFSMMTSVQLCRRPIWWVTLYVPVLLFLFISLAWPDLDVSREDDITLFLLMLHILCFLWRINTARGLSNNKIISTIEFITTLCNLLSSRLHYLAALLLCKGHIFLFFGAHFVLFFVVTSGRNILISASLCSVKGQGNSMSLVICSMKVITA